MAVVDKNQNFDFSYKIEWGLGSDTFTIFFHFAYIAIPILLRYFPIALYQNHSIYILLHSNTKTRLLHTIIPIRGQHCAFLSRTYTA